MLTFTTLDDAFERSYHSSPPDTIGSADTRAINLGSLSSITKCAFDSPSLSCCDDALLGLEAVVDGVGREVDQDSERCEALELDREAPVPLADDCLPWLTRPDCDLTSGQACPWSDPSRIRPSACTASRTSSPSPSTPIPLPSAVHDAARSDPDCDSVIGRVLTEDVADEMDWDRLGRGGSA